ncbi:HalOD1 output domain-containing protein [Haloplanus halophilus]|uniref:HalOD1 output domain-containing protein n=1 Tax=Haloplanus halophilus TaxID=2949993 RepID=UPI00203C9B3D|nr:HalOD1 output domain-containing protein [Haloplanus sp. GDY1]
MSATSDESVRMGSTPHRAEIDWDRREPVSFTVQAALGDVENCDPVDLDPLADYVDPDALEAFFRGTPAELSERSLTFEYEDHTVHVDGAGQVVVE